MRRRALAPAPIRRRARHGGRVPRSAPGASNRATRISVMGCAGTLADRVGATPFAAGARRADSRARRLDGTGCSCYGPVQLPSPDTTSPSNLPAADALAAALRHAIAGCVGAPVQEMSNARQAIRAAERAGAEEHAPDTLAKPGASSSSAKFNLQHGEYRDGARRGGAGAGQGARGTPARRGTRPSPPDRKPQ